MDKIQQFFKDVWTGLCAWFKNWAKAKTALCVGLGLVLVGSFLASMIQTNFFSTEISLKTIEIDISESADATSGAIANAEKAGVKTWSTADIYKPKWANAENPAPLILVAPGIQRTKETQATFCIELVRRGFGVVCLDPYGQGESSPSYESQSATREGYGLFHWMDYMYTEEGREYFSWVDYSRVGATGHSAGGNGAQKLAEREGKIAKDMKTTSRVQAVYITGYIRGWSWSNAACNIGISYSAKDEGAFQNETAIKKAEIQAKKDAGKTLSAEEEAWLTYGNADMRYAPEAIEIVNYQLTRAGEESIDEVTVGNGYGNPYEYTYAVINNENCLHAFQPYDGETLTNLVDFFGYVFENEDADGITQRGIRDDSQIWLWKEIGSGMVLGGGFTFILALFNLLLNTRLFASLKKEIPARTGDQKIKGRIAFWVSFVASAIIACVLYMVSVQLSTEWFKDATSGIQTWFFPQRFTNAIMIWAVANGLIGVAIFFITWGIEYFIDYARARSWWVVVGEFFRDIWGKTLALFGGKKETQTVAEVAVTSAETAKAPNEALSEREAVQEVHNAYRSKLDPVKLSKSDLWKTPLLAAILILSFFAIDGLCYAIFHVDMRFFFLSARFTLNPKAILSMAMYVPIFFIFYMSNSFRVNCSMRPSNWPEWLSKVIAVLGNTLGLVALLFIQYIPFFTTGTIGYTGTVGPQWLFVNMLFSIVPMMAALPLFNRYFFNKTGRAWLGALVICTIFIVMTGSGTTIYYAL